MEISLYGYIVCGVALSQAYAHILYAFIALSIALVRQATEIARSARAHGRASEATAGRAPRRCSLAVVASGPGGHGRPAAESVGPSAGRS